MWKDISFLTQDENISGEDLLQFQVSLNRKLSHALSYIRSSQVINIEANKITTNEAFITNAQIGSIEANKITVVNAKIQSAQIDTITAEQINTGTLTGVTISGVTINGGTFQTDPNTNNDRIVITNNSFATYKGSQLNGLVFGQGFGVFGDVNIYHEGNKALDITAFGDVVYISPTGGFDLIIGDTAKEVRAWGTWNFSIANITGVTLSNNGIHNHDGTTDENGTHNHGFPNTDYLAVYDSVGNFVGYRQWQSSGSHSHYFITSVVGDHTHNII